MVQFVTWMIDGHVKVTLGSRPAGGHCIWLLCPHDIQQHMPYGCECELILLACIIQFSSHHILEQAEVALESYPNEVVAILAASIPVLCVGQVSFQVGAALQVAQPGEVIIW
jgi:hypothetical protein